MTIESMKKTKFSKRTYEDWRKGAEAALKGKPLSNLETPTIEGISLQALYTKEMLDRLGSFVPKQVAAVQNGKRSPGWFIAQEVVANSADQFLSTIKDDLSRGNEMVVYTGSQKFDWTEQQLKQLAELIVEYPIYFKLTREDQNILRVFDFVGQNQLDQVQGVIYSEESVTAPENVRTRLVDTIPVHHAGGTAIHELGVALSILAETMESGNFSDMANDVWVRFAVDTKFFQEIAKLRAFRVLWTAFCSAYGEESPPVPVFTETSVRSYSKLDPYVNLLRAGNAAFSAVLGGTDGHTVHPHDFLTAPSAGSRRIARNVQLIIKEETHVSHVLDASAGSYFIETLTKEFVDAAWNYFLEIEKAGGYSQVIKSGWLADDIQAKWVEREKEIATRKASLIGTNVYANPHEAVIEGKIDKSHLEYMAAKRLAVPFENLRAKSKESILKSAIVHLGPLKEVKGKSDFVYGFLAVAGIEALMSPPLGSAEEVMQFLSDNDIDYAVLCGSENVLEELVPQLELTAAVDVAGKFSEEQMSRWQSHGIQDNLFAGKDMTVKLKEILNLGKEAL